MKKYIIWILILILLVMSCSCSKITDNQSTHSKSKDEVTILTISTLGNSLQTFIDEYEAKHKNVKINIKEYSMPDESSYEKYVKTVNTEILSNNGSDIFNIQGLPFYQYIKKGALKNLNEFVKNDSELIEKNYFMNIIDGCKYNNSYYAIPISYQFNCIGIDRDISQKAGIKTEKMNYFEFLDCLNKIYQENSDVSIMPNNVPTPFYQLLLNSCYDNFIDLPGNAANFNTVEFRKLLNMTKVINDKYINKDTSNILINQNFDSLGLKVIPYSISNLDRLLILKGIFNNNVTYMNFPVYNNSNTCKYLPTEIYGINSASKNSEEAWKFLKFLISEDVQLQKKSGLPVNKKAFNSFLNNIQMNGLSLSAGTTKKYFPPFSESELKSVRNMINNLKFYDVYNGSISNLIYEEALDFYNGTRSVDEVTLSIQERVEIYLGE